MRRTETTDELFCNRHHIKSIDFKGLNNNCIILLLTITNLVLIILYCTFDVKYEFLGAKAYINKNMISKSDQIVTLEEVCSLTGLKRSYILKLLRDASLTRIGKNYWKSEVLALLESRSWALNQPRSSWVGGWSEKYSAICSSWRRFLK